jgi:hypothetical protein
MLVGATSGIRSAGMCEISPSSTFSLALNFGGGLARLFRSRGPGLSASGSFA